MIYQKDSDEISVLRGQRAQLLVALRDLLYKDMELMEHDACDYCDAIDGHDEFCNFADAFELVLQERAQSREGIILETIEIRDALVHLLAEDIEMMGPSSEPCTHCDHIAHTEECVIQKALNTLSHIPRHRVV